MIYFMQAPEGGPIKIGCTTDLGRRHKQLEKYYGTKLLILKVINGGKAMERKIHRKFAHLRMPRTEQFEPEVELCRFISRAKADRPVVNAKASEPMRPAEGCKVVINLDDEQHRWLRVAALDAKMPRSKFIVSILAPILEDRFQEALQARLAKIEADERAEAASV